MILVTHGVIGAGIANVARLNPVSAFIVGFLSHFILDTIPHWDYPIRSSTKGSVENPIDGDFIIGRNFYVDLVKVFFDALFGILIPYFFFSNDMSIVQFATSGIIWGAIGGMTPDFLQFVYTKFRHEPMISLQKFHIWMHAHTRLNHRMILGPALQIGLIVLTIIVCTV